MKKNIIIIFLVYLFGFVVINSLYSNNFYNYEFLYNSHTDRPYLSILIFCFLFIFGMVMLMPIAMFLFVSGIIWGAILGTIISTIATTAAASISFLIMRNFSKNNFSKLKQKISDRIDLNIGKEIKQNISCVP